MVDNGGYAAGQGCAGAVGEIRIGEKTILPQVHVRVDTAGQDELIVQVQTVVAGGSL